MPLNLILFGPPGVGKGAQATRLSRRQGLIHVSTGALLREEIANGTPLGEKVGAAVGRGEFADDETILSLVMAQLERHADARGFVMDGFPRTLDQARRFDELLAMRNSRVHRALLLDAPEDIVLDRLTGRLVCSACGATYHERFKPPQNRRVCDCCQASVVRRDDDATEVHAERLRAYYELTQPLIDYYERAGVLARIDAAGTIEEVARRTLEAASLQ